MFQLELNKDYTLFIPYRQTAQFINNQENITGDEIIFLLQDAS